MTVFQISGFQGSLEFYTSSLSGLSSFPLNNNRTKTLSVFTVQPTLQLTFSFILYYAVVLSSCHLIKKKISKLLKSLFFSVNNFDFDFGEFNLFITKPVGLIKNLRHSTGTSLSECFINYTIKTMQ